MPDPEQHNLITTGFHLPYNPDLVGRAREMRKNPTAAEKKLWYGFLRTFKYRVLRQRPIDNFIVDFYCARLKLVIEIDGDSHFTPEGKRYDEMRTSILQSYGLRVIRITNEDVLKNFSAVCDMIERIPPFPPFQGGKGGI
jgi:very-short-patch-repair endonuclease